MSEIMFEFWMFCFVCFGVFLLNGANFPHSVITNS